MQKTRNIHIQKAMKYLYFLLYLEKYLCLTLLILIITDNKQNSYVFESTTL